MLNYFAADHSILTFILNLRRKFNKSFNTKLLLYKLNYKMYILIFLINDLYNICNIYYILYTNDEIEFNPSHFIYA